MASAPTKPASSPPFLRRRVVYFITASVGVSLFSLAVTFLLHNAIPAWAYVTATIIPAIASGVLSVWLGKAVVREAKAAERLGWKRCWNCGYDLTGVAADGLCPECGKPYTCEGLAAQWQRLSSQPGRTSPPSPACVTKSPRPPAG